MRWKKALLPGLLAAALFSTSCGTVPAPGAGEATQQALPTDLTERFIHQTIYDLRDSYGAGDVQGFMRLVSEGFYGGRRRLEDGLEKALAVTGDIFFDVVVKSVEVEESKVSALVAWSGTYETAPSAEGTTIGGETLLVFLRDDGLALVDFRRDPLFGIGSY